MYAALPITNASYPATLFTDAAGRASASRPAARRVSAIRSAIPWVAPWRLAYATRTRIGGSPSCVATDGTGERGRVGDPPEPWSHAPHRARRRAAGRRAVRPMPVRAARPVRSGGRPGRSADDCAPVAVGVETSDAARTPHPQPTADPHPRSRGGIILLRRQRAVNGTSSIARRPSPRRVRRSSTGRSTIAVAIRAVHSAIFLVMLASIGWLVLTGITGRRDGTWPLPQAWWQSSRRSSSLNGGVCPADPARGAPRRVARLRLGHLPARRGRPHHPGLVGDAARARARAPRARGRARRRA